MATIPYKQKSRQAFVVRDTPAWLDTYQDWISDGARRLYKTMRALMDHKTGRLFIPGRGWIRLRTVEQKAGMCDETRKKYTRELLALNAVRIHRDRVTRTIHGRKRKVLGQAQITVLPLHPPNQHKHSGSSTAKTDESAKSPDKHSDSSTANSSTAKGENSLLQPTSSTVEDFGPQDLSYPTKAAPANGGDAIPSVGPTAVGDAIPTGVENNENVFEKTAAGGSTAANHHQSPRLDPGLRSWARTRILKRARTAGTQVSSPDNYFYKSLPSFLDDLESEVEDFLAEQAEEFLTRRIKEIDPVPWDEVFSFLSSLCRDHGLPVNDPDMFRRCTLAASEILGLEEVPLPPIKIH